MSGRQVSFFVSLLFPCVAAMSQPSQQDTIRTRSLGEVEVTGTQARRMASSTAPLHILGRQQMQRMGIADMADALHRLPGITLRDYGGAGGLKTVSVRGFGAKHTGVSYDGVMLSACQSGETDLSRYSLDNVSHLQLTIGDNDDLFLPARQAANPAVLAIETLRRPEGDERPVHLTAQLKAGSFGYVSPFLKYEQRLSPTLYLAAMGEYVHARNDYPFTLNNGELTTREHRANSRMSQGHGELNLQWLPSKSSELLAKVYYYDNDRQLPGIVRYYTNLSRETLRDRTAFAQVQYVRRWQDRWALKTIAKWNWASTVYRDPLYPGGVRDADYWQREGYASACLLFSPGSQWTFDYSADYAMNNLNSSLPTDVSPYRHTILQSLTAKWTAGCLKATARVLHSLYRNGAEKGQGARDVQRLSPSLSLSWQPFRRQQFFVRASYKNVGLTYILKPSEQTELSLTLDGYQNHVKDKIVAVPYNMFIFRCINVGKVRVRGLDATLTAQQRLGSSHTLLLTANYSYQQAHNRTNPDSPYYGLQLAYTPEHQGAASLSWENPWADVVVHMHAMSDRWASNEHYDGTAVAGYAEWGVTLQRRLRWREQRMDLRFDLKNISDRQYEIVGHYPMPGRSYQLSLSYHI